MSAKVEVLRMLALLLADSYLTQQEISTGRVFNATLVKGFQQGSVLISVLRMVPACMSFSHTYRFVLGVSDNVQSGSSVFIRIVDYHSCTANTHT